jgi:hypothetical protein
MMSPRSAPVHSWISSVAVRSTVGRSSEEFSAALTRQRLVA